MTADMLNLRARCNTRLTVRRNIGGADKAVGELQRFLGCHEASDAPWANEDNRAALRPDCPSGGLGRIGMFRLGHQP